MEQHATQQDTSETDDVVVTVRVSVDQHDADVPRPWHQRPLTSGSGMAALAIVALLAGVVGFGMGSGPSGATPSDVAAHAASTDATPTTPPTVAPAATATAGPPATPTEVPTATVTPHPDEQPCPITAERCIEIVSAARTGDELVVTWTAEGFNADIAGFHAHFFWDVFEPEQAGNNAASFGATPGDWAAIDAQPYITFVSTAPAGATKICATVANAGHGLDDPSLYQCVEIPQI